MRRLAVLGTPPTYLDRYIEIRDRKKLATRTQLVAVHASVASQYAKYLAAAHGGLLHTLKANARCATARAALRACYDVPTQALQKLKADILEAQSRGHLKYCPMCGTTLPTTHDHYLPAERFPEFSVLALNLVPCCSRCNSIKDDEWLDGGARRYLHAFVDDIPDVQFLSVKLIQHGGLSGVGATFSMFRPGKVPPETWRLVKAHFDRLRLIERYDELANDEISEIVLLCRDHLAEGGRSAAKFLRARAKSTNRVYGINHWRAVLMDALANDARLDVWIDAP